VSHKQWICCQIGAREHYAVPRALHRSGRLATLYTDFWAGSGFHNLAGKAGARELRSLAARFHGELDGAPLQSWNWRAILWEIRLRRLARSSSSAASGRFDGFIDIGRRFACAVRDSLRHRRNLPGGTVLFAYDTGALEAMEWCRNQGIRCVLNQVDPNRVEVQTVREEENRWPGWSASPTEVPEDYFRRREQEWALADCVVVNSEFCRQALARQGVESEKLFVAPLSYEADEEMRGDKRGEQKPGQPLRVLFLGQVILRKGIQYLLGAARQLERENIQFEVVGPVGISRAAIASAPSNVTFHGRATRDRATSWYQRCHVFVLPTLSDGFAITQLEAMAHGLPVVSTPCCGEVVSDGVDGFIVPPRDADGLARILQRYIDKPELLKAQEPAALAKARQFTAERLAANLASIEQSIFS
jgi:glycosyltransferase involved in cell wall biosynthesis